MPPFCFRNGQRSSHIPLCGHPFSYRDQEPTIIFEKEIRIGDEKDIVGSRIIGLIKNGIYLTGYRIRKRYFFIRSSRVYGSNKVTRPLVYEARTHGEISRKFLIVPDRELVRIWIFQIRINDELGGIAHKHRNIIFSCLLIKLETLDARAVPDIGGQHSLIITAIMTPDLRLSFKRQLEGETESRRHNVPR